MPEHNVLLYGSSEDVFPPANLRAGPLSLGFDNGDLRSIRLGETELIRRIYVGVRDTNWGTVPNTLLDLVMHSAGDSFRISFISDNSDPATGIHFRWNGKITGSAGGTVTFEMDGEALSTFRRNRLGICLHQPVDGLRGTRCTVIHPDGREEHGSFPDSIAPHQPFIDIRALRYGGAEIRFEGEIFEMEDQRNWTDATYKTYGTPLALPFPVEVKAGTRIRQSISISVLHPASIPVPPTGCSIAGDLDDQQIARLKALRLAHLRADASELRRAVDQSSAIGLPLEIVVRPETDIRAIATEVERLRPRVARWLVCDNALVPVMRSTFPDAPVLAGTNGHFADLNRNRPDPAVIDGVFFPIYPQVHATDHLSVMENCASHQDLVESARQFNGGKSVCATPISIGGGRPDPRQHSLFGAAWTLGSLARLTKARAGGVTYFDTAGGCGLMDHAGVYPVWHVLADVGEFASGEVSVEVDEDQAILRLRCEGRARMIAANLTPQARTIKVDDQRCTARVLDETTAEWAMRNPEQYREKAAQPWTGTKLGLLPFGIAVIDTE